MMNRLKLFPLFYPLMLFTFPGVCKFSGTRTGIHFAILLFSSFFSSCGKNETSLGGGNGNELSGNVPIGISSSIHPLGDARAATGTITSITQMYVFASYTGREDWQTTNLPDFMYLQKMEKLSSGWTYTPVKYWPNATGEKLSFFAFAPVDLTGVSWSASNVAGPKLTYTVPTTESNSQDLLLASAMNKTKEDGTVSFLMKHALSQIKFCVKSGSAGTTKILKGLTVTIPNTGSASFATDGSLGWTVSSPNAPTELKADNSTLQSGITVPETTGSKTDVIAAFFLIPGGNMQAYTVSLRYTLQKTGEDSPVELIATTHFPASPQWLPGSHFTYTLTLVDDRLEFGDVTVDSYGDGTSAGTEIPAT